MTKLYSPVKICNPTSMQHIVWLQPNQDFIVKLDKHLYPNSKIDISGADNLVCEGHFTCKDYDEHNFKQAKNVPSWAAFSSCLLGEVWIDSGKNSSRLIIMLACTTADKSDFITVVNPDCCDIRVKYLDTIEVVLYDYTFGNQDDWDWDWDGIDYGINIRNIYHHSINAGMLKNYADPRPNFAYALVSRANPPDGAMFRQHHYWFKFIDSIDELGRIKGIKNVGALRFYGYSDKFHKVDGFQTEYLLNLHLDFSSLKEQKPKQNNIGLLQNRIFSPYLNPKPHINYYSQPIRHNIRTVRDVSFTVIDFKSIDDDCKSNSSTPDKKDSEIDYDLNYYDYLDSGLDKKFIKGIDCHNIL